MIRKRHRYRGVRCESANQRSYMYIGLRLSQHLEPPRPVDYLAGIMPELEELSSYDREAPLSWLSHCREWNFSGQMFKGGLPCSRHGQGGQTLSGSDHANPLMRRD